MTMRPIKVPGFAFAGVACGIKKNGKKDLALIVSERPATAAALFTTCCPRRHEADEEGQTPGDSH